MPGMNGEPTLEEIKHYEALLATAQEYLRTFGEQISTEKRIEQQKEFFKVSESFRGLPLIGGNDEPLNCAVGILRNSPPSNKDTYAAVQKHLQNAAVHLENHRKTHRARSMSTVIKRTTDTRRKDK